MRARNDSEYSPPRPPRPRAFSLAAERSVSDLLGRNASRREHEHLCLRLRRDVSLARAGAVFYHPLTVGSHLIHRVEFKTAPQPCLLVVAVCIRKVF